MDEIVAFLTQEAEAVRENEPGALRFDVWRDPCDENSVIVCECYIDEDAFEKHKEGQFYRRFDTHVVPDMASQVEIVPFADGFALEAQLIEQRPQPLNDGTRQILLGVYQELCRSHHAITDFRARLLALLPLATGAGAFVLFRDEGLQEWTLPIGLFGAIVTLGLFLYELRQVRECIQLRLQGAVLEDDLQLPPHCGPFRDNPRYGLHGILTAEYAGWIIYGAAIASWLYIALAGDSKGGTRTSTAQWILVGIVAAAVVLKGIWLLWESSVKRPISLWLEEKPDIVTLYREQEAARSRRTNEIERARHL